MRKVEDYIRSIPDFPEPGIIFRDITTVMQDSDGFKLAIDSMEDTIKDLDFDVIAGLESRGFMFGTPIAYNMGKPFVPIRKKGKLPCETISEEYSLEYGTAEIEIHTDAIKKAFSIFTITAVKALARMKAGTICWGKTRSGTIPPAATRMSK